MQMPSPALIQSFARAMLLAKQRSDAEAERRAIALLQASSELRQDALSSGPERIAR